MKKVLIFATVLMLFQISNAQIQMSSNGFVGVGPFWGGSPRWQFDVNGYASISCIPSTSGIYFQNNHNLWSGTWYDEPVILPQWGNSAWLGTSSVPFWRVYSNQVWASDGIIHQSDKRLKKGIKPFNLGLERVKKMNPVSYELLIDSLNLREDKKAKYDKTKLQKIGFIAQEMKELLPEAVVFDENRKIYGIDYSVVIPVVVQALKEQQTIIESLQTEIQELKKGIGSNKLKSATTTTGTSSIQANTANALYQNAPNPFSQSTTIEYSIAENVQKAMICIYDMNGTQLKCIPLHLTGYGNITINGSEFKAGMYMYSLIADGQLIDTKRMVLTD